MSVFILPGIPKNNTEPFAGFITADIDIKKSDDVYRKSSTLPQFSKLEPFLIKKIELLCSYLKFVKKCSFLCVSHRRDYVTREDQSLAVFPYLHNFLLLKEYTKRAVSYLTQITVISSKSEYKVHARRSAFARPWFPYRCTYEFSFFLIGSNGSSSGGHIPYKKWVSLINASKTQALRTVWHNDFKCGKPTVFINERILDLFCSPENTILDCIPNDGNFAIAAKILNRNYVGIYQDEELSRYTQERLANIDRLRNGSNKPRLVAPSNSYLAKPKAGYMFSRWGG